MEEKKCRFCKKAKKRISKYAIISIYLLILVIIGQIQLVKFILSLLNL